MMTDSSQTMQSRQLEVLVQIAQLITTLDLDEVLAQTVNLTTDVVGASKGSFLLLDAEGHTLQRFMSARDLDVNKKQTVSMRVLEGGLAGWVRAHKQAALIDDTADDPRWLQLDDKLRVRSTICVPFILEDSVRGIMTLEHPEASHFTQDDLRLAQAVANQAGSALHNAQLFDRIRTQQRQLEAVLGSISESVLVIDQQGQLKLWNSAARDLFGPDADIEAGKSLGDISDRPLITKLMDTITAANVTSSTQAFELRDEYANRDFVVNVAVLREETPGVIDYVIALYDVTSIKDLNRLKTHMIRMASHDLKNPLALLVGYLDMISDDIQHDIMPDPSYIQSLYKAITKMETLIASLLDTERAEQNAPMTRVPISPYELVKAVMDDLLPLAAQHHHNVIQNLQTNLHPIKGDFVQLREAVANLVSNAIKYTPDGGTIKVNAYTEDDRIYFSVDDSGYGVPVGQQSKIFQPYFRATQKETDHIEGSGVGLSLVKEVVGRHGGNVWFSSQEGSGSTFGFWLPML